MNAELAEQLERYRRKFTHLIRPSTEPWQHQLDTETYFCPILPSSKNPAD